MELRHLRYFAAVAEHLSFTKAAHHVHVTQSTLSHQIRQLEEEIGRPLFDRVGKRVSLTEAGELLLPRATLALKEIDASVRMLKAPREEIEGRLSIAATHTFFVSLIPECVAAFLNENPRVTLSISELAAAEVEEQLSRATIDIGVCYQPGPSSEIHFEPLYDDRMVLVVRPGHPLSTRKRIRMADLHHERLVLLASGYKTREMLDECLQLAGAVPSIAVEANSVPCMIEIARIADIGAVVPEKLARKYRDICILELEGPAPVRTPGLCWIRDRRSAAAMRFAAIVREAVRLEGG